MSKRIAVVVLAGGLLALTGEVRGQEPPPKHRNLFNLKHADAGTIADVLKAHFKNEAVITPLPLGSGNGILVSGPQAVLDEVQKLVGVLDRTPKTVAVEVVIAEILPKTADGKELTAADFTGPTADVMAKLDALPAGHRVGTVQRLKLSAVEGQPVATTTGGSKPVTTASSVARPDRGGFGGGGAPGGGGAAFTQKSISYHSVGTTIRVTGRTAGDDTIVVDLDVKDTRLKPTEGAAAEDPPSIDTATLATKVSVTANRAVAAQALRTDGKAGPTLSLVIVTARLADPAK
jgi:hypothetical protein